MTPAAIDVPAERAFALVRCELGVSRAELANRRRQRSLVRARALFAWQLRQVGVSFPRIGRAIDRDHSTVINLIRVARDLRRIDPQFAAQCDRCAASLIERKEIEA